jgi:branched-chain amino acid transport system substrate-binding protein
MKRKSILIVALILVVMSALFGACSKDAVPETPVEETKDEITIVILDDFSGPAAALCTNYKVGSLDCIRYINEEKGGILGHPLKAIVIDHKMDNSLVISGWDRAKSEEAPIVISQMGTLVASIGAKSDQDHIPVITLGGTMDQYFPKELSYYFALTPQFAGIYDSVCQMVEKDWAKRGENRPPKVGFDIISLGTYPQMMGKAARMYTEKRGWKHNITLTPATPADVTTQVLQMKEFGADYIYLNATDAMNIAWLKSLDRQNFHPGIYGTSSLGSEEIWNAVGDLAVGTTSFQYIPQWTDPDIPFISLVRELNAKWYPDITSRTGQYLAGFACILVMAESMERAIEKVGYENLSGDAMQEAMETIRDFDPGIGIGYTWTPTDHQGLHGHKWYQRQQDSTIIPASDWIIFDPLPDEQRTLAWWLKD